MQIDFGVEFSEPKLSAYLNLVQQKLAPSTPQGFAAIRGIYKFQLGSKQNVELVYCLSQPGQPRPSDFSVPKGSGHTLITLRRASSMEVDQANSDNWASSSHFGLLNDVWLLSNRTDKLSSPRTPSDNRFFQAPNVTKDSSGILESNFVLGNYFASKQRE